MEIVKRVIEYKHFSETIFCSQFENIDANSYLLGFKDSIPVLSNRVIKNSMYTVQTPTKDTTKRTVKVETNSETGEKFIMLNGKKIKILAESELPKNSHIRKLASLQTINNTPVKIKILKGISKKIDEYQQQSGILPNLVHIPVDKTVTSQISSKIPINENKLVKIMPASTIENIKTNTTDKSSTDSMKHFNPENTTNKPILVNNTVLNKLMNNHHSVSVQSAALDLTKNCESQNVNYSGVMTEDKCLQTEIKPKLVSREVQTEDHDLDLDSLLKMDFLEFSSMLRELENNTPITAKKILDPSLETDLSENDEDNPKQYTTLNSVRNNVACKKIIGNGFTRQSSVSGNSSAENFFKELRNALQVDDQGNMPIHVGVVTNDLKLTKRNLFLLKIMKQPVDIRSNNDQTPLQSAIINDSSIDIIGTLLANGASVDVTDSEGNNVLHYAVEYERKEALKLLLNYAASTRFNIDEYNHEGITPLMLCCLNNLHDCAEILLEADADPNVRDQISGRTALFHAAERHDVDMVEMLLQFNASTKIKNFFGTSPHDAMYEIEDMPEQIKFMILGKNNKRKIPDDPRPAKYAKNVEINKVSIKTYGRFERSHKSSVLKTFTTVR